MVKSSRRTPSCTSAPRQRRRDARVVAGPRAVRGRQRLAENVLQVVDVDARAARLDVAFDGRDLRVLLRDHGRDDLAEDQARLVRDAGRKRDVDVQAVGARCLGKPDGAEVVELVVDPPRDVEHARERDALGRVEIERDVIGGLERRDPREPGILRDGGQLRHVQQRLQVAADEPRRHIVAGHRLHADVRRHGVRRAVLVEGWRGDAIRQPLHRQRPVLHRRQDVGRGLDVVAEELAFRELLFRPEDLAEIGDAQLIAVGEIEDPIAAGCFEVAQLIEELVARPGPI